MPLSAVKSMLALLATAILSSCGGNHGSAAAPPADFRVEEGEGGVTLYWTGVAGVDYWAYAGQSSSICKNCGNSTNNWNSLIGAQSRGWASAITPPYFFTGSTIQTGLNNDVVYSFIMDGRINGGPGGNSTPSVSAKPRLNGAYWYTGGAFGQAGITSLAFGPILNTSTNTYATTSTYLALGSGGIKYQSSNGLNWTAITTTDAVDWKGAAYAFPGNTTLQKFVGVGAGGKVVYSLDLANWTLSATAVSESAGQDLNAVASNASLLVAVGNNGSVIRSSDGITWYAANPLPSRPHLYAVAYTTVASGSFWVAVGAAGKMFYSSDAINWNAIESGSNQDLKGVASLTNTTYSNGVYTPTSTPVYSYAVVAVGKNGTVTQSSDLVNWTAKTLGSGDNFNGVVASTALIPTNQFMIVGEGGQAFTSPDGVNWTSRTDAAAAAVAQTQSSSLIGLIRGYNNQYLAWATNGSTIYSK